MLEALSGKSGQGLPRVRQSPSPAPGTRRTRQAGAQPVKVSLAIMIAVMAFGQPV